PQLWWPITHRRELFGWGLSWLGPGFLLAFVVLCLRGHRASRPATFALVTIVVRVLIFSVTHHEARFYASYTPLLLVFVVGVAWMLLAPMLRPWAHPRFEIGLAAVVGALYVALQPLVFSGTMSRALAERTAGVLPPRLLKIRSEDVYQNIRRRTPSNALFAT